MKNFGLARFLDSSMLSRLRANPELQSAVVRILTNLLGALYIGVGAWSGYYQVDLAYFLTIFVTHFFASLVLLASVLQRGDWPARRYFALCLDVIVASLAIFITQDAISPFYLLYILIFISAGTRFGRGHLALAAVVAVVAYNLVLIQLDEWRQHPFEAGFFLLLLILLPWYQASLLRQLQQAREDAERANRAKGDFLAFMTHELRTPLSGVSGMASLLEETELDAEQRDYVGAIRRSGATLDALIGDVLDFSKIEAGKLALERIPFDPQELTREVCEILAAGAREKGLDLICWVDADVPRSLRGDPLRMRQILFNLLGNAIKFTESGEVEVRLSVATSVANLDRPHLLLEVRDTGIGIPADKLDALFEGFTQVDASTTRRFGGSGLGLAIARNLSRLMGGEMEVTSEEGRGSRFQARLPLLAQAPEGSASASDRRLRGLRILVVESNARQRGLLMAILGREGASTEVIAGAWSLAAGRARPDVVILGDSAPGLDLSAQVDQLRAGLGASIPCLALFYVGSRPRLAVADVEVLSKPFLPEPLVLSVLRLAGRDLPGVAGADDATAKVGVMTAGKSEVASVRVLVAEDNEIAAKVLTTFLTKLGVEHSRFRDGEAALAAALQGDYQLALVDLHMPRLDGFGFARRCRAAQGERRLPIVALTANASEEERQRCLASGMDDFLSKPVRPAELRRVLETLAQAPLP
ncbi:response regulator [Thiorhodococcus mannitoliphagus]|uniref:histidine kinase n=1 Tax=Thiorhodococcus mannitoliphagus TaxID=329406 RepID=A0A6P1DQL4_9GAMM|nr:ATP-binding protein [Thiorhodococcus mannitoliphagus]NEX19830.1 response regulator [Thiorhodococcus mannitoliphagus]